MRSKRRAPRRVCPRTLRQPLGGPFSAQNGASFSLLRVVGGKGPGQGPSRGGGTLGTAGCCAGPLALKPITVDPAGERGCSAVLRIPVLAWQRWEARGRAAAGPSPAWVARGDASGSSPRRPAQVRASEGAEVPAWFTACTGLRVFGAESSLHAALPVTTAAGLINASSPSGAGHGVAPVCCRRGRGLQTWDCDSQRRERGQNLSERR